MNKILIALVVVVIVAAGGWFFLSNKQNNQSPTSVTPRTSSPATSQNAVSIQNFSFSPNTIHVKVGESVTWINNDAIGHSATADDGSFDTGIIQKGESKSITFSKAGTFSYHCTPHPYMKATVIVE